MAEWEGGGHYTEDTIRVSKKAKWNGAFKFPGIITDYKIIGTKECYSGFCNNMGVKVSSGDGINTRLNVCNHWEPYTNGVHQPCYGQCIHCKFWEGERLYTNSEYIKIDATEKQIQKSRFNTIDIVMDNDL